MPLAGMPHLGSGITWHRKGRRVMATPHLREGKLSVIDMKDWAVVDTIKTGGAGFLGNFVVEKLKQRGAREIIVPRIEEYDLTEIESINRLFDNLDISKTKRPGSETNIKRSNVIIIHLL